MVGTAGSGAGLSVLIVEDGFAPLRALRAGLERAIGPAGERVLDAQILDHGAALTADLKPRIDVALLDANRHPNDRVGDPSLPLLAGPEVADRLAVAHPTCRVIGYSATAADPAINITMRGPANVSALYEISALVDHMAEALWSTTFDHQVPPPGAADFAALGLLPGAQLWEAVRVARSRSDTWEAVARTTTYRNPEKRTREHLNIHLRPLLPTMEPVSYRHYVEILRRVTGFS